MSHSDTLCAEASSQNSQSDTSVLQGLDNGVGLGGGSNVWAELYRG